MQLPNSKGMTMHKPVQTHASDTQDMDEESVMLQQELNRGPVRGRSRGLARQTLRNWSIRLLLSTQRSAPAISELQSQARPWRMCGMSDLFQSYLAHCVDKCALQFMLGKAQRNVIPSALFQHPWNVAVFHKKRIGTQQLRKLLAEVLFNIRCVPSCI